MDQFDAFFRRADLDRDGRISGAEAVAFFQGSNLPKPVLAQENLIEFVRRICVDLLGEFY
ncbi:putative EF-hand domain-containing protein [Helianthus annuus]|nr:putative EF-hand domain-containing protein [Helianthus annuus]